MCTTDFFAPVVDDPYDYGRVAAANALSDVWAMGGRPLVCLNIVAFPSKTLPLSVLGKILEGGADKVREAGAVLIGGHSIEDTEPKYGLAVVGEVHPRRVFKNVGAKAGDVLVLTKPLGSGIATTALKRWLLRPAEIREVVEVMATLNRVAGEVLAAHHRSVRAVTDVTGYGLLGHLLEMLEGARVDAEISFSALPRLRSVARLLAADVAPGGTRANLRAAGRRVQWSPELGTDASAQLLVADAQTSGGLLASVDPRAASKIVAALRQAGVAAGFVAEVGRVVKGRGRIRVVP